MRLAKRSVRTLFLLGAVVFYACGSPALQVPEDLSMSTTPDLTSRVCVSSCTLDTQCQNSCALPSSAINCCTVQTKTCYVASATTCPAPPPDMTVVSPY